MTSFEETLTKINEEVNEVQRAQLELNVRAKIANEKLGGFLREHGLSENFTLSELAMVAIRKSRE